MVGRLCCVSEKAVIEEHKKDENIVEIGENFFLSSIFKEDDFSDLRYSDSTD